MVKDYKIKKIKILIDNNKENENDIKKEINTNDIKKEVNENDNKKIIIELFRKNIKNKKIELENYNIKHCGKEGHWLEKQMNIKHNSKNEPDLYGYEMKKNSKKITFGDFSASEYLFSHNKNFINEKNNWKENLVNMTRDEFIKIFGTQKPLKHNRYSWSGTCVPTYNNWNDCGQNLLITEDNNICIYYSYSKDKRNEIKQKFPEYLKKDNVLIVIWKNEKIKENINKKFNNNGFFIIKKKEEFYNKICFGKPFNFDCFIKGIKDKTIIFDSGMYIGNTRNYSQFRSSNETFWNELIIEEYE